MDAQSSKNPRHFQENILPFNSPNVYICEGLKRERGTVKKKKGRVQKKLFCTVCGDELENFGLTPQANDIESVKKGAARCRKIRKTDGLVCSKRFIADPNSMSAVFPPQKRKVQKRKVGDLKKSILRKIRQAAA